MTRSLQHEASPARGAKPDRPAPGAGMPIRSAPAMLRRAPDDRKAIVTLLRKYEVMAGELAEKPDAKGLAVPGMPMGSPGMEVPDGRVQPYTVELVAHDGSTSPFARHGD